MNETIKANELRIGNLVIYSNGSILFKVIGISEFGIDIENEVEKTYIEYDEFEPIQLTEEWLLKFGFEKQMMWTYAINIIGNQKLIYYLGEKGWSIGNKNYSDFSNLKYVHQLQNIYFALTGEELTIKEQ
jgi:hypothetical protein